MTCRPIDIGISISGRARSQSKSKGSRTGSSVAVRSFGQFFFSCGNGNPEHPRTFWIWIIMQILSKIYFGGCLSSHITSAKRKNKTKYFDSIYMTASRLDYHGGPWGVVSIYEV